MKSWLQFFKKKPIEIIDEDTPKEELKTEEPSRDDDIQTDYFKPFQLNNEEIRITDFNYLIDQTFKQSGFLQAEILFSSFWNANNSYFNINDAHRLVSNFVDILKKEKWQSSRISDFIENHISIFPQSKEYTYVIDKAKMLKKFDINLALDYLAKSNNQVDINLLYPSIFIESVFLQSQYLLKEKKYELSFVNLSRLSTTLIKLNQLEYLKWAIEIDNMKSEICFNEPNPKYEAFIFFEVKKYLLRILKELSSFPYCKNFYRWKKESIDSTWPFDLDNNLDTALYHFGLNIKKSQFINEFHEFAFNELPILYGFPKEYLNEYPLDEFRENSANRYEIITNLNDIANKLQTTPGNELEIIVSEFSQNLFQKYYNQI